MQKKRIIFFLLFSIILSSISLMTGFNIYLNQKSSTSLPELPSRKSFFLSPSPHSTINSGCTGDIGCEGIRPQIAECDSCDLILPLKINLNSPKEGYGSGEYGAGSYAWVENAPDLTVTNFVVQWPRTETIQKDSLVVLAFTIENKGNEPAKDIFWILKADPTNIEQTNQFSFSLNSGESKTTFARVEFSQIGEIPILLKVDPRDTILESDETNNDKSMTIQVV